MMIKTIYYLLVTFLVPQEEAVGFFDKNIFTPRPPILQ